MGGREALDILENAAALRPKVATTGVAKSAAALFAASRRIAAALCIGVAVQVTGCGASGAAPSASAVASSSATPRSSLSQAALPLVGTWATQSARPPSASRSYILIIDPDNLLGEVYEYNPGGHADFRITGVQPHASDLVFSATVQQSTGPARFPTTLTIQIASNVPKGQRAPFMLVGGLIDQPDAVFVAF